MATPNTKTVPITLDRERHLLLNLNAYCIAEELTGKNYIKQTALHQLDFRDLRALLFAGLKHEDASLTLDGVGELVDRTNFDAVGDAVMAALTASKGEEDKPARPLVVPPDIDAINAELDREAATASIS